LTLETLAEPSELALNFLGNGLHDRAADLVATVPRFRERALH
jgi:hypothetical protein